MEMEGKVALITGAGSGIGEALASELGKNKVAGLALVDLSERVHEVAQRMQEQYPGLKACSFVGDVRDEAFRKDVFDQTQKDLGLTAICVPVAGITRDALTVKIDKTTGQAQIYAVETFREVMEVNLIAPIYWALETIARIAGQRRRDGKGRWEPREHIQGTIIFIGSVSSLGNKGQISYATAKAGLEGAAATLMAEAIFHGVRCGVIHPGYTDTPMVRALGEAFIEQNILPQTQLRRLIRPEEIANAICFMISNSAVSGQLWADAGWHPIA